MSTTPTKAKKSPVDRGAARLSSIGSGLGLPVSGLSEPESEPKSSQSTSTSDLDSNPSHRRDSGLSMPISGISSMTINGTGTNGQSHSTSSSSSSSSSGSSSIISSSSIPEKIDVNWERDHVFTSNLLPTTVGRLNVCAYTHIGKRKNQEDRFVFCPDLLNGEYAFFGVFDGTVKEHASEWVHKHILPILLSTKSFTKFHTLPMKEKTSPKGLTLLEETLRETFAHTDRQLIKWCASKQIHYSSSTAVVTFIHFPSNVLLTAHLGDSHCVIGIAPSSKQQTTSTTMDSSENEHRQQSKKSQPTIPTKQLKGRFLTFPHRADDVKERKRIEASGGSVVYLHDKPFIRGGDFHQRDHAMQLNYSRAFGGKDLKMYGLSPIPDLRVTIVNFSTDSEKAESKSDKEEDRIKLFLMGSDGIWDVISPDDAVNIAYRAQMAYNQYLIQSKDDSTAPHLKEKRPASPAECLAHLALKNHKAKGSNDNVTCLAAFI